MGFFAPTRPHCARCQSFPCSCSASWPQSGQSRTPTNAEFDQRQIISRLDRIIKLLERLREAQQEGQEL